jgi:hypothetical protein
MQLIAARQGAARAQQIDSLRKRYPALAEEIGVVADLCDELADSFSIPADTAPEPYSCEEGESSPTPLARLAICCSWLRKKSPAFSPLTLGI